MALSTRVAAMAGTGDEPTSTTILAVDGGNSKTDLALVSADGTVLAGVRGRGASHQRLGMDGAMASLRSSVQELYRSSGLPEPQQASVGVFCLAGVDLPIDEERLREALAIEDFARTTLLQNDTFAVLRAGSPTNSGVAITCGTGLNCVGIAPDGRKLRFPAIGRFSGDFVAGGRWLGVTALGKAIRASDGRGRPTALQESVPSYFGLDSPLAVTEALYTGRIDEQRLLELAPTVFRTAAGGDDVALALLDSLADEIETLIAATLRRLDLESTPTTIVLGGGLLRSEEETFMRRVVAGINRAAPLGDIRVLDSPPVVGAALLGLDHVASPLAAGQRLTAGLDETLLLAASGQVPAVRTTGTS